MRRQSAVKAAGAAVVVAAVASVPLWASSFVVLQIGVKSLWLAIIAMSLIFLHSRVGMTSLAQVGIAGVGGYGLAILTTDLGIPIPAAVAAAVAITVVVAALLGLIAVRTLGIYFLMITLAYGVAAHLFAQQARQLTNGHTGISGQGPPVFFGVIDMADPASFYLVALAVFLVCYAGLRALSRTAFGTALEGVRDSPLRMRALGFNVGSYRVLAFTIAGAVAAIGGILSFWYNGRISPGTIDLTRTVDVLVIAVIGGLFRLEGAAVGALLFTVMDNYVSQFTDRYNSVIGVVFILVLLFAPRGLAGLAKQVSRHPRFRFLAGTPPRERTGEEGTPSKERTKL